MTSTGKGARRNVLHRWCRHWADARTFESSAQPTNGRHARKYTAS